MLTQWVVKVSKFCNLRCEYCYELPELGDRARMSREQVGAMFAHVADYYARHPGSELHFVWHGGEPLLQDPDYYRGLFDEQKRRLAGLEVKNFVQTNLTVLDDKRIALLRELDGVGVSLDLFGHHRLSLGGKTTQERVVRNLDRLRRAQVPFGCITVLTRRSLPHVDAIFRFYERLNVPFRVLPLFRGATDGQHANFQVSAQEVLDALCRLFDLWFASPTRIHVEPLSDLLTAMLRRRAGAEPDYYDRRNWEEVVVVNTNGDLFADADAYAPGKSWGNIFATPLDALIGGAAQQRSVAEAEARMASACARCEYFGACRGHAIAEETRLYEDTLEADGRLRCVVERGLCAHIDRRLAEAEAAGRIGPEVWRRASRPQPAVA